MKISNNPSKTVELKDIVDRRDVITLVDNFYAKVKIDPLIGPVFSHLNWEKHLPIMYNFWSSLLFADQSYSGNPIQKHIELPLGKEHFTRWLLLFEETVNANFEGVKATEVKMRTQAIAAIFQRKMSIL